VNDVILNVGNFFSAHSLSHKCNQNSLVVLQTKMTFFLVTWLSNNRYYKVQWKWSWGKYIV